MSALMSQAKLSKSVAQAQIQSMKLFPHLLKCSPPSLSEMLSLSGSVTLATLEGRSSTSREKKKVFFFNISQSGREGRREGGSNLMKRQTGSSRQQQSSSEVRRFQLVTAAESEKGRDGKGE